MTFCTQCGNKLETNARFCGKCGTEIKGQELPEQNAALQHSPPAQVPAPTPNLNNTHQNSNKKKPASNKRLAIIVIAALLFLVFYLVSPKQLTELEYEELAIKLLVKDNLVMDDFGNAIEYSGVDIGYDPYWTEDYTQLVEPAKVLEREFAELGEMLEEVKPPKYFEYEHEILVKFFHAHKNMASDIVSYMSSGGEHFMESSEEYERRAEDYLEESIFLTDLYEDRIMEIYRNAILD